MATTQTEGRRPERVTTDWYRDFAQLEARGQSAIFEEWALGVAGDPQLIALIDTLPLQKRQPNLVFATARLLGVPEGGFADFKAWLVANWESLGREVQHRMTQTNEPRRCTAILPALALAMAGERGEEPPIALLELGASAGLCLYPDRYSCRYGASDWLHPASGPSPIQLTADIATPIPLPTRLPNIVWRGGIDLEPLDVRDPDDARWLQTLIWPEQHERRKRIEEAMRLVRAEPPLLVKGNAIEELAALAALAPSDSTLVIVTSVMLVYLPYLKRMELVEAIRALDAHWISIDMVGVLPEVDAQLANPQRGQFTLSLDGTPLATVGAHGQFVDWAEGHPQPSQPRS